MPQEPRTHLRFRIEPQLQKQLEKARKESGRTLTAEITERLKKSFSDEVSAGLKDLREELIRFRSGMMDEIRRELDGLRVDLIQRKDDSQ
jgi:TraY domain